MKSILIIGTSNAGKSTTMREVCKRLKPSKVFRLIPDTTNLANSRFYLSKVDKIFNKTFIIEVQGKYILVVAGAPTEQKIRISVLIEICIKKEFVISYLLVSMRSYEKIRNFDTRNEMIDKKCENIMTEKICRISSDKFEETIEWNKRIDRIIKKLKSNF